MATVLIVEDEAVLLVLAESVLQSAGHATLTASTLTQAQAVIGSDAPFDVVVTDIALGDDKEGGIQIGRSIRNHRSTTPVLYTSGFALTDGLKELFVDNSEFLPKPYTDQQLLDAIAGLLQSKQGRSIGGLFHSMSVVDAVDGSSGRRASAMELGAVRAPNYRSCQC